MKAIRVLIFAGMFTLALALRLAAQTADTQMASAAYAQDAFQLTPATPALTRSITVDPTSALTVSVLAASRTLSVGIVAPDGTRYRVNDPPTGSFESGFFPIDTVNTKPGASYLLSIVNPAAGLWALEVSEGETLNAPLDVVTTTYLNNGIWLVLVGGGDDFPLGANVRLAVVAFDGTNKISGLSISAGLLRPLDPTFTPESVTFQDDGTGGDEVAGDGIYEAFVKPASVGTYQVQVAATGPGPGATTFRRTAATELRVVPHNAQINGFTDQGVDDNGDGLYDRIGITPTANLLKAGTYSISVRLRASNGNEVQRSIEQSFSVGSASAEVTFSAADIVRDLGVEGPYNVVEVRYLERVNGDLVPADIRYDLGQTAPYSFDQLQHQPLRLSGLGDATGHDTNGNGLYDSLEISIGIIADFAGTYNYSTTLVDGNGREIGFRNGSVALASGNNILSLTFDGAAIGAGGKNGPYFLSNFLMFGAGESLIATKAFTTPAFLANQFEGFVGASVFGNISTRMRVGNGDNVLIGGFVITGTDMKTLVVRGIGPSVALPGVIADPMIEVYDSSGVLRGANDNWKDAQTKQQIIDSGLAPTNDLESALWGVINPGAYTVVVRGKDNATGIGLFEVYDLDQTVDSKLANISTRGFVDTGDDVMIGGTIILGDTPTRVLVRAIGPSLSNFGVPGALPDPVLELRDVNGALVAGNDDWRTDQEGDIIATTIAPTHDLESAILQTLMPGAYTAIVRGFDNSTGVALVEAYQLQ
jgi:hypothetical protein